jgi:cation diffusion facilitator CzcD-associated flavoprotein CzcO
MCQSPTSRRYIPALAVVLMQGFSNWKWPSVEGLDSFKGKLLHSASWDDEVDCKDKRVVVIGNGSSGVQIVASLAAGKLHVQTQYSCPRLILIQLWRK